MARKPKPRVHKVAGGEQYLTLGYAMLKTDAWRDLSGNAIKVWFELHIRFHGTNNGKLSLSVDEASRCLHMGKATVSRAFHELVENGFLELTRQGQWYGRKASEYALTTKPADGKMASHAYKKWVRPRFQNRTRNSFLGSEMEPSEAAAVPK